MGTKNANKFKDTLVEPKIKITSIGKAIEAIIEPKETYFEIISIITNTKIEYNAATACKPISNPNKVAIPFPPLKPV